MLSLSFGEPLRQCYEIRRKDALIASNPTLSQIKAGEGSLKRPVPDGACMLSLAGSTSASAAYRTFKMIGSPTAQGRLPSANGFPSTSAG